MANICCDDVYFYSESHPEYLTALWEDLETSIVFCRNEDLAWIGNLFRLKNISTDGISLRGTVIYMAGTTAADFNVLASGLLPGTTYYYAAYLDLGAGVVYGETKSFTTPDKAFDVDNDLVDLGLSTKWARCNLGASKETELGGLFGFGDLTGYNTSIDVDNYANADIYRTANDVANKVCGGKVTMPTIDEFEELFRCCKVEWTETDGVSGYRFTGPNGNSIDRKSVV